MLNEIQTIRYLCAAFCGFITLYHNGLGYYHSISGDCGCGFLCSRRLGNGVQIGVGNMNRGLELEREIIRDLGASRHPNSGAMKKKHDGSDTNHVYEIKTTIGKSFSVVSTYWRELKLNAAKRGREPALIVLFESKAQSVSSMDKVVVVDYEYFKELIDGLPTGDDKRY